MNLARIEADVAEAPPIDARIGYLQFPLLIVDQQDRERGARVVGEE